MPDQKPPALVFSHFGYYVPDYYAALAFNTDVLGFALSDEGYLKEIDRRLGFTTRRPFEHHQLVVVNGRRDEDPSTVAEIGFLAPSLSELRRIHSLLEASASATDIAVADHGVSWTVYAVMPGGVPLAISVETPWYVPQPQCWSLAIDQPDAVILAETEARCRAVEGFRERTEWRAELAEELDRSGRLLSQATRSITPVETPADAESVFKKELGTNPAPAFPDIAMHRIGLKADDPESLADFYRDILGYLETGRGEMPAVGASSAAEHIYLTRDPDQFAQLIIVSGRAPDVPSSINQLTFRVPSLDDLRDVHDRMRAHPGVGNYRPVHHGNSFSLYCSDPEGNMLEISYESQWYIPAPAAWPLDFEQSNEELLRISEETSRAAPGFMLREDWKQRARTELIAAGRLEAEELVQHI